MQHFVRLGRNRQATHRAQIAERLGIRDVAGLVRFAVRTGIVSADK